jgi:E3 ubiquitin-protein ligase UBR4
MELLVRGHIVSLDLPIHLVYEQVWRPAVQDAAAAAAAAGGSPYPQRGAVGGNMPMEVVYRLQGLDGEATEPIVDVLHDTAAVDVDPEEEAAMTGLMSETKGLAIVLQRVKEIDELAARVELEPLVLGLLHSCCRLRVNRRAALSLGAVHVLLARITGALQQDPLPASAELMLLIVEQLVEEVIF